MAAIVNEESGMGSLPEKEQASQSDAGSGEASINFGLPVPTTESARIHARRIKVIRPPAFSISTIFDGVRTLAQYSDLLYTLSLFRLNVRYKQSVLGWAWALLQPLALMGIYTIIFTRVTTVTTGGTPYPVFVFSGLLPWIFFSTSIASAVQGLVVHPNLLTKMYFPREIIPLSYLAAGLADFCIASMILSGLIVHYHVALTWNVLYAVPIVILLGGFAAAIALFFSAVQVRFRDVGLAMPFVLQVWMFTVPVVYSLQSVPLRFRKLYLLDPVAGLIENFRMVVLHGTAPSAVTLMASAAITILCFGLAYAYFKSAEATMADVI
jgi:lipopolysaccharide transport system permease protein